MGKKKNMPSSSNIGRRTGINILQGKLIRQRDDGIDNFDDYWTDSDSTHSDHTTSLNNSIKNRSEGISGNVFIQNSVALSPMTPLKSSLKRLHKQSEEYDDYGTNSSPRVSKKKSITFSEDVENAISKMTQTSNLLDETESSRSKNRMHLKEIIINKDGLFDSENNSSVRKSPRILSNTFAQNRRADLPVSMDDTIATSVTLSHEIESEKKAKNKSNSRVDEAEGSLSKNRTYTQISDLKEIRKDSLSESENDFVRKFPRILISTLNEDGLFDSENNSSVRKSPRILSNTFAQNRRADLPLPMDNTNAASVTLSYEMETEKNAKNNSRSRVDEAEVSPSKNRTYTKISDLKETGLKNIDPSRSERNSSMRRSRVLSNALNSSNSTKKDDKSNSSGSRYPLHATKSNRVSHRREGERNENIRKSSVRKSPIAVKRNMQASNMRKSSVEKSPIAVKRKMQAPNTLESSSLSKAPHIQNRGGERSQRNYSFRMSSQHAANSSEALNREESLSSMIHESDNRSEILVSSQKRKEHMSSVERSSRASEHNIVQVSNRTGSHMNAVKPVLSARRKIDFSETKKDILQVKKPSPYIVRRSSRMRFPPLASWRNERPKFVRSNSGEIECVGIDKGQPEDDYAYRILEKKLHGRKKIQKPTRKTIKKTTIVDYSKMKTVKVNLQRPFSTCVWTKPMNDESAGYMISKLFSSQLISFGYLEIAAHSMKDEQRSISDNIYFVVVKGVVDAVIAKAPSTFQKGDTFIVPIGTGYSISNNTSSRALLNYCIFKLSIFEYQRKNDCFE